MVPNRANFYFIKLSVEDKKNRIYTPQLNHITLKLPPFNMLSERSRFNSTSFCNETSMKDEKCVENFCACTHVLSVKLHSVVELILVDQGIYIHVYMCVYMCVYVYHLIQIYLKVLHSTQIIPSIYTARHSESLPWISWALMC